MYAREAMDTFLRENSVFDEHDPEAMNAYDDKASEVRSLLKTLAGEIRASYHQGNSYKKMIKEGRHKPIS